MSNKLPCHIELISQNFDKTTEFYRLLFGWMVIESGIPDYRLLKFRNDFPLGGAILKGNREKATESRWPLIYIRVDNMDVSIKKAEALGANIMKEKTIIDKRGSYAIFMDPDGNQIGLWQENK